MADDPNATPETQAAPAASPKPKLVMVIALALVGLGCGGAAGAFVAGPMVARKLIAAPAAHGDSTKGGEHGAKGEHGKGEGEGKEAESASSYLLDNLVLNPAGSGGGRYLLASVSIRYGNASLKERMTSREAEMRDAILHVLGTKPVEELSDIARRDAIKAEVRIAIEAILGPKSVQGVFFPQFVIQ